MADLQNVATCETSQTIELWDHYHLSAEYGSGSFGKVVSAVCRGTGTKLALKLLSKSTTTAKQFQREFSISYFLSPHRHIVDTYNVAFSTTDNYYVFAQEQAPLGDLFKYIDAHGTLDDVKLKKVIVQISSALSFMHDVKLVHRDVKLDNILFFDNQLKLVKLSDFGLTRKQGVMVKKLCDCTPYSPPEVTESVRNEWYTIETVSDSWSFGVLLFCCSTGTFPWRSADICDSNYQDFLQWQKRKTVKIPPRWRSFTPRALRLFRRLLESKPSRRCPVTEANKYLNDDWRNERRPSKSRSQDSTGESISAEMTRSAPSLSTHKLSMKVKSLTIRDWVKTPR